MLIAAENSARYWLCGGEIFALGGPLPLAMGEGRPSPGCRPLKPRDLQHLHAWHRAEARSDAPATGDYHRLCLRDAERILTHLRLPERLEAAVD
jgi:hypothetical protein